MSGFVDTREALIGTGRGWFAHTSFVIGLGLTAGSLFVGLAAPLLTTFEPFATAGPSLAPPGGVHWMGTDALGRDLWSGIAYGARTSWLVAGSVSAVTLGLALAIGMVSGAAGGPTDHVLMRLTEIFQVIPRFFLVIFAVALFGPGLDRLIMVLALTSWASMARVVRAETLSVSNRDFVTAARAAGASESNILLGDILPNVFPSALVLTGLLAGRVILIEASLSFLGLGDASLASWGQLAAQAQGFLRSAWWLVLFPGAAIAGTVLGLNLLVDEGAGIPGDHA